MRTSYPLAQKMNAELVRLLYVQSRAAVPSGILTALCLVYALYHVTPTNILLNWFFLVFIVSVLRYTSCAAYFHEKPDIQHTNFWYRLFIITTILGGINWLLLGTVLLPLAETYRIVIAFTLASVVAISISIFAASRFVSILFILIVLPPFALKMFFTNDEAHHLMAIFALVYFVALLFAIFRIHNEIRSMFKLQIENDELIHRLYATKNQIEHINKELQSEINDRKQIEILLRNSEEQYRLVTDALPVLIAYIDNDLCFQFANKAYQEWFNKPLNEIINDSVKNILGDAGFATFNEHYPKLEAGQQVTYETTIYFHNEQERYVSVILIPNLHEKKLQGVFSLISDITPRINYLATHDSLTNLPNRSLFNARVTHALRHAHRHGTQVALLFLDVDHFKNVNDTLGHDVGDQLLVKIVERLQSCVNESDTIARLGGDEFIIILENIDTLQRPAAIAKAICDCVSEAIRIGDRDLFVTTSIGISVYPEDGDNMQVLLKNADMAMYRAKEHGRNTFEFYTGGMNDAMQKKLRIETSLRTALEKRELKVYYQPIIDIRKNQISGFEALLRWSHPQLGFVSPGEFIPIAVETDLIVPIGEWAMRTACKQNLVWQQMGYPPSRITVNLSARQFMKRNLVTTIEQILRETGLEGRYLIIELTESLVMGDIDYSIKTIKALKNLDIAISLDDFGTGYSSLSYLKRFPFDIIKIDRSFVTDFSVNTDDAAIVKAIIAMAHNMKMKVAAVGVEKPEQYMFLKEHGCDEVQGYLLYPPLSEMDVTSVLQNRHEVTVTSPVI